MQIISFSQASAASYDAYVSAKGAIYHTRAWLHVLRHCYGYEPASLIAQDAAGKITGVLPLMRVQGRLKGRRLVSLPFSHCVPILAESAEIQSALLDAAVNMTRDEGYSYLELKTRQPVAHEAFRPSELNFISELDLSPDLDTLYAAFSQGNRRNIKKAQGSELTIREGTTPADFHAFYRLEVSTRHRQGAPIYPANFFPQIYDTLRDFVRLYMMSLHGRDVAGLVVFQKGERAVYAYGGSARDEAVSRLRPNNWLMWHAIQQAKQDGCQIFDFGTTPLHLENLLAFKQHFRPTHEKLPYWYFLNTRENLPTIQRNSASVKLAEMALRLLPEAMFRRFSPLLLREVG